MIKKDKIIFLYFLNNNFIFIVAFFKLRVTAKDGYLNHYVCVNNFREGRTCGESGLLWFGF